MTEAPEFYAKKKNTDTLEVCNNALKQFTDATITNQLIKYYMQYDSHMVAAYMCGTTALLHVSIRMYGIVIRMKHCVTYYRPVGGPTRSFYVRLVSDVSGTHSECASI